MSIIKRKKQNQFFIMSNHAAQKELTSLSSIGLLAYIISLPEDFRLYKTYLQKKFTRRTVDSSFKELVEKRYIGGFSCYINRKKEYFYIASDEQLTQDEFNDFVEETYSDIVNEREITPKSFGPINDNQFVIPPKFTNVQNVQHSNVHDVQYKKYSTTGTVPNVPIQSETNKDILQKHTNKDIKDVNNEHLYIDVIQSLFLKHGEGLFTKEDILYFTDKILSEVTTEPTHPEIYFTSIVEMIVYRRKKKLGLTQPIEPSVYNWLEI